MHNKSEALPETAVAVRAVATGRGLLLFLALLAMCTLHEGSAYAGLNLLWVQNVGQGVGASYHFFDNTTNSGNGQGISLSKHEFLENYRLGGDFSLLSPRIINGSAEIDVRANQQRETNQTEHAQKSSELSLGYLLSVALFKESPTPLSVGASSQRTIESPAFTRSFELNSDVLNMSLALRNKYLPVRFTYLKTASQTSGLEQDRRQTANVATLNLEHRDGLFSVTGLDLLNSDSENALLSGGTDSSTKETRAALTNALNWHSDRSLARTLNSSYIYDLNRGLFRSSSQNIASGLRVELGKALSAGANYSFISNATETQRLQSQTAGVNLSHHLYESLTTSLSGTGSSNQYSDGTDNSYGGGAGLSYQYRFPSRTIFSSSYSVSYSVADRKRTGFLANVENERHAIPQSDSRFIVLANSAFQGNTLTVRGAQTLLLYSSDADFNITQDGIQVIPGRMVGDTDLLISYSFLQDPQVTFASTSQSVAARLNLVERRCSFYFDYRSTDPMLLHGEATAVTLSPSYHADLGYEYTMDSYSAHFEYGLSKSFSTNLQYLNARWDYQRPFGYDGLSFNANNYLNWNMQSSSSQGNWDNSLSLQSNYSRKLNSVLSAKLGLGYFNSLNAIGTSNLFSANCNVDGRFGKTVVTLSSNLSLSKGSGSLSRSESVSLSFQRYF